MSRLIKANLVRLKKSKLFWGLVIAAFAVSVLLVGLVIAFSQYLQVDMIMFAYPALTGVMIPVFVGIFIGTEYSDGTIRNKLMIGHSRESVFLANLITALIVAGTLLVSYLLLVLLVGLPVVGAPAMGGGMTIATLFVSLLTIVAICALHVMVSMLNSNKTSATVINLVVAFLSFEIAMIVSGLATGMTGIVADICQVVADILPMGQAVQFVMGMSTPLWLEAIYAAAVSAICIFAGIKVFKNKDVK